MSYSANQYNYCTPLSSSTGLTDASVATRDSNYFTLFDNTLDGSYYPITGDVGLWGTEVAGDDGVLQKPFVVTVEESLSINALSISGSVYSYPVDFTVQLYSGNTLLYTYSAVSNNNPSVICLFPETYNVTKYIITVTKISSSGVARLRSAYQAWYVQSSDAASIKCSSNIALKVNLSGSDSLPLVASAAQELDSLSYTDDAVRVAVGEVSEIDNTISKRHESVRIYTTDSTHITNTISKTYEVLPIDTTSDIAHVINTVRSYDTLVVCDECHKSLDSSIANIHAAMKAPSRRIYGKVLITYTDPLLNDTIADISTSGEAYNSSLAQLTDGRDSVNEKFFTLYDNDLSGSYKVSSADSQVGWTSDVISDSDGYFHAPPYIILSFQARPVVAFKVCFDNSHYNVVKDFDVEFTMASGETRMYSFTDNVLEEVVVNPDEPIAEVTSIKITVKRVTKAEYPAVIVDVPTSSEVLYVGYQDKSDLISIDVLEELTYEDDIEALGGMSANEVTVVLDNTSKEFNFSNSTSPIAKQLRRNRKIVPYLGAEVIPGEIEWHTLGTYWSYSWDAPIDSLTASVVGFDTIGLLGTTFFTNHQVLTDVSLGFLIDYVLTDAKKLFGFLKWSVADELYDVIIPYAWFAAESHAAALRKISQAYPMHIYCDRQGQIVAAPQKLQIDYYYDTWSDSTNVIEKTYSSLHTVVPNLINVTVLGPIIVSGTNLVEDTLVFNVSDIQSRTLNFGNPYISDFVVDIDCDATVNYTYEVYAWGAVFTFTGTGTVRSIKCTGSSLDTSNTASITHRDNLSIMTNGVVTRDIYADFIQTSSLANFIISRLVSLATLDKYDVEVTYRGDIALTINDPILLLDGISPSNKYNIKRHQLTWDGGLIGTAQLNT